ncbi:MAG TPA: adenosine deaminase, partial [Vicinamibacteria bacterium]|nr:adenosine deaminase [Vicinamibacteria bacterium]
MRGSGYGWRALIALLALLASLAGEGLPRGAATPILAAQVVAADGTAAETRTAAYLDSIRHSPPLLRSFLSAFPKGADLHNHLSGAIYAESYIAHAAEAG